MRKRFKYSPEQLNDRSAEFPTLNRCIQELNKIVLSPEEMEFGQKTREFLKTQFFRSPQEALKKPVEKITYRGEIIRGKQLSLF